MEKMIKIEIELDEQKILADGKFSPEELMNRIDEVFAKDGFPILEADACRRVYRDNGDIANDFGRIGADVGSLAYKMWFVEYAYKMLWIDDLNAEFDGDWNVEDCLKALKKVGVGYYDNERG